MRLPKPPNSGAKLFDDSFAEFTSRADLPEFDIIGLHGIWTWISDENGRIIVDLIRRKLRVGGIVYISYNCLPGWAPSMPLRHLVKLHADLAAEATGLRGKLDGALAFARQVIDSGALYFQGHPAVSERLKLMSTQNRNYLAHEYLNEDWRIMAFSDVAKWLDDAKLTFVTSAHLLDHVEAVNLTSEGSKFLAEIEHPILRQSVRDYFVNQHFRRDVFIKGPRSISRWEQQQAIQSSSFALTTHADGVPLKAKGARGETTLPEQLYRPVIEVLAEDGYAPKTAAKLVAHSKLRTIPFSQVLHAIFVLVGAGHVHPAQEPGSASRKYCRALNRFLCERARGAGNIQYLASPVTGGGVPVSRFQQLFLLALEHDRKSPHEQVDFARSLLSAEGQRVTKDGKPIDPSDEIKELTNMASDFTANRLPLLKALEIA